MKRLVLLAPIFAIALTISTVLALPPPFNLGLGGLFKVYDAHNTVIGEALGSNSNMLTALFRTQGHTFIACWNTTGFWSQAFAYYTTPDCTGQAYYLDVSAQPALACGTWVTDPDGRFIMFPDASRPSFENIQSGADIGPDGPVTQCFSTPIQGTFDAFSTIIVPTFTLPFRVQ